MIELYFGNYVDKLYDMCAGSVDTIIMDPPYDIEPDFDLLSRVCRGNIVCFCAPENEFFRTDERAYWIKTPSTKNYTKHLGRFVEVILIARRGDTFNTDLHWSNYTGVYTDMILTKQVHPFEKPLSLMERLVLIYSKFGDIVCDPFMGSGRTGQACKNTGRSFLGCEIDPKWFNLAKQNMEEE